MLRGGRNSVRPPLVAPLVTSQKRKIFPGEKCSHNPASNTCKLVSSSQIYVQFGTQAWLARHTRGNRQDLSLEITIALVLNIPQINFRYYLYYVDRKDSRFYTVGNGMFYVCMMLPGYILLQAYFQFKVYLYEISSTIYVHMPQFAV